MAISNASNQIVKVNLIPGIIPSVLHLSQYDTGAGRPITFSVYDGSQAFTIPSGVSIAFEGTKPDGNGFSFTCSKSGSNALLTNYTNQMTALPGKIMCQLVFTDTSGGRVGSLPVLMIVTPAGINGDTVISDSDIEAIVAAQNQYAVLNARLDAAIDQVNTTTNKAIDQVNTTTNKAIDQVNTTTNKAIDQMNTTTNEAIDQMNTMTNEAIDQMNTTTNDLQNQYAVTNAKLDTAISAATQDSEVQDIRVKADGTTASTAGNAVRAQITDLKGILNNKTDVIETGKIESLFELSDGKNLLYEDLFASGYLNANGTISENAIYATSDFVPVEPDTAYFFSLRNRMFNLVKTRHLALQYNANREIVANSYQNVDNTQGLQVNTSNETKFVRLCVHINETNYFQLEKGTSATDYEAYSVKAIYKKELGVEAIAQIDNEYGFTKDFLQTEKSKNLIDDSQLVDGILNSAGTVTEYADYRTTDFIPVEQNETYFFSFRRAINGDVVSTRHVSFLYDINKNPMAGSFQNISETTGLTIQTGNAFYVRCSIHVTPDSTLLQLEKGNSATQYEEYFYNCVYNGTLGDKGLEQVVERFPGAIDEYIEDNNLPIYQTKQLFDRSKIQVGFCNTNGHINDSLPNNYVYTEKIDVSAYVGKTIYFSNDLVEKVARFVCAYDANGTVIPSAGLDNGTSVPRHYTVPSGVDSIRISYNASLTDFQAEIDEITPYTEYGKYIEAKSQSTDILNGKKWAVCGDSFTAGATTSKFDDGVYKGFPKTYQYFIGNRTGINVLNFFDGGKTLAYPSDESFHNSLTDPTLAKYYQNIPADVDYITIYLGINDSHHENGQGGDGEDPTGIIPLGTLTDSTTATYYGAWNVVLTWLLENRPFAHIGIIVSNGCDREAYRTAQLEIAKKYGVPYIDLNGDERTPAMIRTQNPDISSTVKQILRQKQAVDPDGSKTGSVNTHPNDEAHEFESTFIENFLRSI